MASSFALPDARRIRSYLLRLPLSTRALLSLVTAFYLANLLLPWLQIEQWGALIPQEINFGSLYRLNTYPLLHKSLIHYLLNTLSLIPLLERFEAEHGTIVTFALFTGPFSLLPGLIYTLVERFVLFSNTPVVGASIWSFVLLAAETVRNSRTSTNNTPYIIRGYRIPSWFPPLAGLLLIATLLPQTSFLGHCAGAAVGCVWGTGYVRFLAPPDKVLRWVEAKLNLLGRLPHYVSVDQKTYGRYGVLPTSVGGIIGGGSGGGSPGGGVAAVRAAAVGSAQGGGIHGLRPMSPAVIVPPSSSAGGGGGQRLGP